jgi:hypothetical protein
MMSSRLGNYFLFSAALALLTSACSSLAPVIPQPKAPPMFKDSATLAIARKQSVVDPADIVYPGGYSIRSGSSVVISVPSNFLTEMMEKNAENLKDSKQLDRAKRSMDLYNTSGYFNYAEQQIEKELIRVGFTVLDRAKFEAKLRELRSPNGINRNDTMDVSEVIRATQGADLTSIERARLEKMLRELRNSMRLNGNEMIDISEVIRAAQSGENRADYVLQINQLKLNRESVSQEIRKSAPIQQFIDKYPEIANAVPDQYSFPEYSATFNAKLIEVATGRIVWVGGHTVTSRNIIERDIQLTVTVRKFVTNEAEVTGYVERENTEEVRKKRGDRPVSIPPWKYDYKFDFQVLPDLNELEPVKPMESESQRLDRQEGLNSSDQGNEKFISHRDKLLRLVVSDVMKTVPSFSMN